MMNYKLTISTHRSTVSTIYIALFVIFLSTVMGMPSAFCQQMPYYTQFKSNNSHSNPAVVGTKRLLDARLNYRTQWVGFDDSPITKSFSLNGRIVNGTMGLGTSFFNDRTGPSKRSNISLTYAYHAKFEDVELSLGVAGHLLTYRVDGTMLHMRFPYDNTINLTISQKKSVTDVSAGFLLYNDRFHFGISALNLAKASINYFPGSDTIHRSQIDMVPHYYSSLGYNWSGQLDWIWENSLQVVYAEANPMTIDYNLRLHYREKIFGGIGVRLRDAIAFQFGASFLNDFQVSYSYDFIISSLRSSQSGSHEIMLVWSSNIGMGGKKKYDTDRFKRQKYSNMF